MLQAALTTAPARRTTRLAFLCGFAAPDANLPEGDLRWAGEFTIRSGSNPVHKRTP